MCKVLSALVINISLVGIAAAAPIQINEIRIDQAGTDNDEYFELLGTPNGSLDGIWYLVIGDGSGGSGAIEEAIELTGILIPGNGYFVAAESTFSLGAPDFEISLNFENGDNVTHLLVSDFTGSIDDDLDVDDDGTLDATPWTSLLDAVSLVDDPVGGDKYYGSALGFVDLGPDPSGVFGHGYRLADGPSWRIGDFDPVANPPAGTDTPGFANIPEPGTFWLIGLPLTGLALVGRKHAKE